MIWWLIFLTSTIVPTQVKKVRTELAIRNHYAVPFLSRADVILSWYDSSIEVLLADSLNRTEKRGSRIT